MVDIAVIIVNWNAREDLSQCLHALFDSPPSACSWDVWVVDNNSADSSADMVASDFPQAKLIRNTENAGFSRANNQAIAASQSRYVLLLNSDAFVHTTEALDRLVEFGDANPKAAIVGAHVLNVDGTLQFSCRHFPGLGAGLFRNTYLGRLFPNNKWAKSYLMSEVDHSKPRQVDWVSGCAMMIRRDMIDRVGALDERFFMYCEDVDICKRAWDNDMEVWYCADAIVTHKIGASSDKNAEKMIWEFHHSWEQYYAKHNPHAPAWRRLAVHFGLWLRATIRIYHRHRNVRRVARQELLQGRERTRQA
jgi:hypothetical protein